MRLPFGKTRLLVVLAIALLAVAAVAAALPRFSSAPSATDSPNPPQSASVRGDLDGDDDVDQNDLNIVLAARNTKATGPNDIRDLNKDSKIDALDARILTTLCMLPRCEIIPPDPGDAGKQTLEGVDSDQDGVRDDIQRYIATTYLNSEKTRQALKQYARAAQELISFELDKTRTIENAEHRRRATLCAYYVLSGAAGQTLDEIRARLLNTPERTRAYLASDDKLSGESFSIGHPGQWKGGCNFDPDSARN